MDAVSDFQVFVDWTWCQCLVHPQCLHIEQLACILCERDCSLHYWFHGETGVVRCPDCHEVADTEDDGA